MKIIESISEMNEHVRCLPRNVKVGLVPTMGALHEGHQILIQEGKAKSDYLVVSIFVNPLQFGPNEDYANYPRTIENDINLCKKNKVDVIFLPKAEELTNPKSLSYVKVSQLDQHLCGSTRQGHFRGVCTIISKLFNVVQPQISFFGEKDLQQLRIIEQMVIDLNYPIQIVGVKTVRNDKGLALSSRNKYLQKNEQITALIVPKIINFVAQQIEAGGRGKEQIIIEAESIIASTPGVQLDYLEIVDNNLLQPTGDFKQDLVIAIAVYVGNTRLIDNRIIYYVN